MTGSRWGTGVIYSDGRVQDAFIQKIAQTLSTGLRVAVLSGVPKKTPGLEQVAESMGPVYKGLVPLVKASLPLEYRIVMGHQCDYSGRGFVHLTMTDGKN